MLFSVHFQSHVTITQVICLFVRMSHRSYTKEDGEGGGYQLHEADHICLSMCVKEKCFPCMQVIIKLYLSIFIDILSLVFSSIPMSVSSLAYVPPLHEDFSGFRVYFSVTGLHNCVLNFVILYLLRFTVYIFLCVHDYTCIYIFISLYYIYILLLQLSL